MCKKTFLFFKIEFIDFLKKIFNILLELLYPQKCLFCKNRRHVLLCHKCEKDFLNEFNPSFVDCLSAQSDDNKSIFLTSFEYKKMTAHMIKKIKFEYIKNSSLFCANFMKKTFKELGIDTKNSIITFVPMFYDDECERGFNLAKSIAYDLANVLDVPCIQMLVKISKNLEQKKLNLIQRQKNIKNIYAVKSTLKNELSKKKSEKKNIILVDDIITTGSTLIECKNLLKNTTEIPVICATFCKVSTNI